MKGKKLLIDAGFECIYNHRHRNGMCEVYLKGNESFLLFPNTKLKDIKQFLKEELDET